MPMCTIRVFRKSARGRLQKLKTGYRGNVGRPLVAKAADEPPPLLFDLEDDPLENSDLAKAEPERVERLTAALHDQIRPTQL